MLGPGIFQPRWKTPRRPGARYRRSDAGWRERASRRGSAPHHQGRPCVFTQLGRRRPAGNWSGVGGTVERRHRGVLTSREPCPPRPLSGGCIAPALRSEAALDREQGRTELVISHCAGGTKMESRKRLHLERFVWTWGSCPLLVDVRVKVEKVKTFEAEVQRKAATVGVRCILVIGRQFPRKAGGARTLCIFHHKFTPQPDHFSILFAIALASGTGALAPCFKISTERTLPAPQNERQSQRPGADPVGLQEGRHR